MVVKGYCAVAPLPELQDRENTDKMEWKGKVKKNGNPERESSAKI
jgi:hypothetical protein